MGFNKFLYRRPETACKGGEDGFVDDPFLGGVIGVIINRDQVIEGFNQFGFRFGGVEVGCGRSPLFFGLPPFPPSQWSRLRAESLRLAAPRRERRPQRPALRLEGLSQVGLDGSWAGG